MVLLAFLYVPDSLQIIAEGANGPTTPEADKIFLEKNIMVIPVSHPCLPVLYILGIIIVFCKELREEGNASFPSYSEFIFILLLRKLGRSMVSIISLFIFTLIDPSIFSQLQARS